jgi:hypothetical protein
MSTNVPGSKCLCTNRWRFSRVGGFDQVCLQSGSDLLSLRELDQKLWAALSCPTKGLEFDGRTLELIDSDQDGRIRAPEIIAAVEWAASLLNDPNDLLKGEGRLSLSAINESTSEGREILASARQILSNLGKPESLEITIEDTADIVKIFSGTRFNGDGIIPIDAAEDEKVRAVIEEIISCVGSETDRSGSPGVSSEKVELFFKECKDYSEWWSKVESASDRALLALADSKDGAAASFRAIRPKVEDFFLRCRLAEYDPSAAGVLNPSAEDYRMLAARDIATSPEGLSVFPLAHVEPGRPLPLTDGLNPSWASLAAKFHAGVILPIFGEKSFITWEDWTGLTESFTSYEEWLAGKQGTAVERLGITRVREILSGKYQGEISALIEKDKALESQANAIASVDRLLHYCRDLCRLLNNFICFHDFYTPGFKAIFQAGTLYMDGRCCEFCVKVSDVAKHSAIATLSHTYLAYCECIRGAEKMVIAAAITEGDADNLLVGRNGVFYDRKGLDWDATIVKIIDHPISIRQAFWSPYKRIARMVTEQIEKFAATRDKNVQTSAAAGVTEVEKMAAVPKPVPEQPFDVAKFAGIFAAIGLAVGAIGTAIASVVTGFLGLKWWQMPLTFAGLVLVISGPSMLLAYLNLRKRNLAPILDANGWAINTKAMINIPFGSSLTCMAKLPDGAQRTLLDPFAQKEIPWRRYAVTALLALALLFLLQQGYLASWLRLLFKA